MALPLIILGGVAVAGLVGGVVLGRKSTDIVPTNPSSPTSPSGIARTAIGVAPVVVTALALYGGWKAYREFAP